MLGYRSMVKRVFDSYKRIGRYDPLQCIPIYRSGGDIYGYLRPITKDYRLTIECCAKLLGQWRLENPTVATGTFKITEEKTEKWLDYQVIGRDDRILFFVMDVKGTMIGQMGLAGFNYQQQSCEVDAVVRGVKHLHPGMMEDAIRALVHWGIEQLSLRQIYLKVFMDNVHAIRFYERCGFEPTRTIPLQKILSGEEERWEIVTANNMEKMAIERYFLEMKLAGSEELYGSEYQQSNLE